MDAVTLSVLRALYEAIGFALGVAVRRPPIPQPSWLRHQRIKAVRSGQYVPVPYGSRRGLQWSAEFADGFWLDFVAPDDFTPLVGDVAELYGEGFGRPVTALRIRGKWIYDNR